MANTTPTYDLNYALSCMRDAIDYAEMDGDFQPARKWLNELEKSIKSSMSVSAEQESTAAECARINQWLSDHWDFIPEIPFGEGV